MHTRLFTRNFLFLLLGQAFSLIGNYTLKFALSMYVLEKTGSAGVFGGRLAAAAVPRVGLSPLGGVLADRVNRRTMMVVLDTISGGAVGITFLLLGRVEWFVLVAGLQIILGILGAFESPTVQACIPQMHSGDNLLRANAMVNQIQAVAALVTPFAGSLLYAAWGIRPVLAVVSLCFFATALLECFLVLPTPSGQKNNGAMQIIKKDLTKSVQFLRVERPEVLHLLWLATLANFLAAGCVTVGVPYMVRTALGLSATWYGVAESLLGAAAVLSGLAVNFWGNRWQGRRMSGLLAGFGWSLLPVAAVFLLGVTPTVAYLVLVAAMGIGQILCGIFSILGLCLIQQRTPQELTGKVMAFVMSISLCAQPLGQLLYGVAFDVAPVWLILTVTGIVMIVVAFSARDFFAQLTGSW